jgi:hypothetical protein
MNFEMWWINQEIRVEWAKSEAYKIWQAATSEAQAEIQELREALDSCSLDFASNMYDNRQLQQQLEVERKTMAAIDKELRGKVCDPDPVKPIWNGPAYFTETTYGLVSGIHRERNLLQQQLRNKDEQLAAAQARIVHLIAILADESTDYQDWVKLKEQSDISALRQHEIAYGVKLLEKTASVFDTWETTADMSSRIFLKDSYSSAAKVLREAAAELAEGKTI